MAGRVTVTSVTYDLTRCWECNKIHSQVVYLNCGHNFCMSHLDAQLTEQTEGSRQPCRACFKLTVPANRAELRALTSALPPAAAGLSLEKGNYQWGMFTTFPQCNFSLEFPEILSPYL